MVGVRLQLWSVAHDRGAGVSGFEDMMDRLKNGMEEQQNLARVPFLGDPAEEARRLLAAYGHLSALKNKNVGDLVVFRPGLKNLKFPAEGQPVVVTGFDFGAVDPEEEAGGNCYKRPCDMRIGVFGSSGDFSEFWVDARRFMLYTPDGDL